MSVDSIGDFLTIIRNGTFVAKPLVTVSYSKMKEAIAHILKDEGFIRDFEVVQSVYPAQKKLKIFLKYVDDESVIHSIIRASKPGCRYYTGKKVKPVIGGLGISILSTSRGVVSNKQAKKLGVGGEVICTIW